MSHTVLVCDDAIFMRTMISDILSQAGFEVVGEAETGREAVEKYRQLKPDLVTMDIVMPDLGGIEATYDKTVRGREGKLLVQTDARRHVFSRLERSPTTGASLELTIDEQLQYIAEREVRAGVQESRADAGTAVIMDPHTGEILAMASWPTFNPNDYSASPESARRNRAVQDLYEPGSTFKLVTASAAIEEGVIKPHDVVDVSAGMIRFGSRVIDDMHRNGQLTFAEVIVKSSNVGAIKVGLKLGAERMGLYIRRFGFGRPSSPDFPGESPGIVWEASKLDGSALASVSMGSNASLQVRSRQAGDSVAGMLNHAMARSERRQTAVAVTIIPKDNMMYFQSVEPGFFHKLEMPENVRISGEEIEKLLGVKVRTSDASSPRHSGGLERHYAPKTPAVLVPPHALDAEIDLITALITGYDIELRADGLFQKFRHEVAHVAEPRGAAFRRFFSAAHVFYSFERRVGAHVEHLRRLGRVADPVVFRPIEFHFRPSDELFEIKSSVDRAHRKSVRLGDIVDIVRRDHMTRARHVLHDNGRIARQMLAHKQRDCPSVEIVQIAGPRADDNRHSFPLIVGSLSTSETHHGEHCQHRTHNRSEHRRLLSR